jgi:hypothetical protein
VGVRVDSGVLAGVDMWGLRAGRQAVVGQTAEGHLPAWSEVENYGMLGVHEFGSCVRLVEVEVEAEETGAGVGSGGSGAWTAVVLGAEGLRSRAFEFLASVEP